MMLLDKHSKKVSVIIVNYNGMPHIEACISSVLRQTYPNFEVILVDSASLDDSLDYAKRRFTNLVIVETRENLGYAGGINRGLEHATGEYIALLNIDTEVGQSWLAPMVEFLDKNPPVGAVTPKILLYDKARINALGLNIHITGLSFCRDLGKRDNSDLNKPLRVAGISGCSFLVRRELLDRLGGLNERFFMYCDDTDLSWVMNLMNYQMYCIPESIVYHKYQLKMDPEKLYLLERNRHAMLLSTLKPLTFVACFPFFAIIELLVAGYCLIRGKTYLLAKLKALHSVYQNIDDIKERRARIQRLRVISDLQLFKRLQLNLEWNQLFHILK